MKQANSQLSRTLHSGGESNNNKIICKANKIRRCSSECLEIYFRELVGEGSSEEPTLRLRQEDQMELPRRRPAVHCGQIEQVLMGPKKRMSSQVPTAEWSVGLRTLELLRRTLDFVLGILRSHWRLLSVGILS